MDLKTLLAASALAGRIEQIDKMAMLVLGEAHDVLLGSVATDDFRAFAEAEEAAPDEHLDGIVIQLEPPFVLRVLAEMRDAIVKELVALDVVDVDTLPPFPSVDNMRAMVEREMAAIQAKGSRKVTQ